LKLRTITGGEDGIGRFPIPPLHVPWVGSISMKNPENFFYFGIVILGLSIWLMWFFTKTPLGQVQIGMRDNAKRIDYLGYKVPQTKAVLYVVSGAFAGVAGSIYGLFQNLVSCDGALSILVSFAPITNAVVGGIGSFFGPIWGSAILQVINEISVRYTERVELVQGLILVLVMMFAPTGFVGIVNSVRQRRAARSVASASSMQPEKS
jgi:branched-chain amino acid transport system permease protein